MKRSEYVKLVNDLADSELEYLKTQIMARESSSAKEELASLIARLYLELPSMSARISATIIEKSGLIQFDPEDDPISAESPKQNRL